MHRLKPYAVHLSSAVFVTAMVVGGVFGLNSRPSATGTAEAAVAQTTTRPAPSTTVAKATVTTVTPPTTAAPVTAPPVTEPPVTAPPVTAPPVTAPPVTAPPAPVDTSVHGACGGNLPPCCVMMRESHGNPTVVNRSSGASGKWQFMTATWAGYGGYATAAQAPESVQDAKAAELWAGGSGSGHWGGSC